MLKYDQIYRIKSFVKMLKNDIFKDYLSRYIFCSLKKDAWKCNL